nr:hypothetical protein [Tanacetum cinerariifolium]
MKTIIKVQVQDQVSKIMTKIEKYVTESLEAEVLVRSTNQPQPFYAVAASLSELKLKKILTSLPHEVMLLHERKVEMIKTRMKTPPLDQTKGQREGDQAKKLSHQKNLHIRSLSPQVLRKVYPDLNQNLQASLLMQRSMALDDDESQWNPSSSPTLDREWHVQECSGIGEPLGRSRQVIPLDQFINKDLEYLKGGSSSKKYTTSITKMKAADYGQVKWIEDKVSRIWSPIKVVYDKHAYWGTYYWGPKRQKFYAYASNMETSKDVYSGHMIIVVTSLKIMKYFGYSHLEEIIVRRQNDHLYKFRERDFKRLHRQDIQDIRIVIQERVEDLQLGVESYHKKINLTRPDTYRSYLKRMTLYTAYPDIQGIIYEDEMNINRLMRTDELHKFSDGTLNYVRTALNGISIGIEMDYLPKRK